MAFIATAAAAVVTTINSAFVAAAGTLLPGLSFGAQVATANFATKAVLYGAAAMAVSATTVAMLQPKTGAGGSPTDFKADPSAPISGVMGRFGVGGRQAHGNTWGKGNLFISFATVLSLGPIDSVQAFTANEQLVTFPGPQGLAANVEPYKDKMWMTYRLGLPSDAALGPPTGQAQGTPSMSEWTSAHRMPQFAHAFWTMRNNSKSAGYEGGVPKPQWTVRGMKVWDPRKDSTYPGGSGAHRRDDWRTWEWSENPHLHALAWVRGHHKLNTDGTIDLTKRLAGVGAPDAAIDIAAFVAGANIADANGWAIAGEWSTQDDKWQTLAAMLQAGGAVPVNRGAHISCLTNTPLASIYHLTNEDLAGPVNLSVMTTRRDRINTIVPRYRSEPHFWEQRAAGPVTSAIYRAEDRNEARTREVAYNFVAQAKQAAELAAYDVANARESLTGAMPCKPHLLGLRAGDAFTATVPEAGLSNQKFVVAKRVFDPSTCVVTLEVRSETDAKHAWALGQAANPAPSPSLTAVDPLPPAPVAEEWSIAPTPPGTGGVQIPGLDIDGTPPDVVSEVLIEVSTTGTDPWDAIYKGTPPSGSIPAPGLLAGQSYYVRITYFNALGAASAPLVRGPFTAGSLVAGNVIPTAPTITNLQSQITTAFGDIFDVSDLLADARDDLDAVEAEVVAARGGSANLAARVSAVNQARIDGDNANASAISGVAARTTQTEADIIDLELAVVNEATARATAVNQLTAQANATPNLIPNGNFEKGSGEGWDGGGALVYTVNPDIGGSILYSGPTSVRCYPRTPPANVWSGYAGAYSAQAKYQINSSDWSQACLAWYLDDAGTTFLDQTPWTSIVTDNAVRVWKVENALKPAAARSARVLFSVGPSSRIVLRGAAKIEAGPVATAYTPEATTKALSASVTETTLALIDLDNQLAGAGFRKVAEATGGAPAYYEFFSSNEGGYAAIAAPVVALVNTAVDDDPVVAMELVGGKAKFFGDVAISGGSLNINNRFMVSDTGEVMIRDSTGSNRIEQSSGAIKVFNAGVKRVQLGNLAV